MDKHLLKTISDVEILLNTFFYHVFVFQTSPTTQQPPSTAATTTATPSSSTTTAKEEDLPSFRDKKKFFEQEIQDHSKQKPKEKGNGQDMIFGLW